MYLALEVDDSKQAIAASDKKEAIDRALKTVRSRIEGFGVSEPVVQKQGDDRIVVQIPGIQDRERAERLMQNQAFLQFKITDKSQALERDLPKLDQIVKSRGLGRKSDTARAAASGAAKGLQGLLTQADTSKKVELPLGKTDSAKKVVAAAKGAAKKDTTKKDTASSDSLKLQAGGGFSSLLQQGDMPGEFYVANDNVPTLDAYLADSAVKSALPPGKEFLPGLIRRCSGASCTAYYLVDAKPIITGDYLNDARPNQQAHRGHGRRVHAEQRRRPSLPQRDGQARRATTWRSSSTIACMGRPPVIQSAIGTRGQITMGGKSTSPTRRTSRSSCAPARCRCRSASPRCSSIGPSLGQDSIDKGTARRRSSRSPSSSSSCSCYYRFSGLLAVLAARRCTCSTRWPRSPASTPCSRCPGSPGFVLSIGIAVDANVLIFERIREELARGKTVRTAIDEGFRHAMPAIVDSNVSTILTAAVLYQYGTGPVKGFAVTLIAGIVASLVTSIFVVRTFYLLWLNRSRGAQTLSI